MELAYYKNNVQAAKDVLSAAEFIDNLLTAEGVCPPDPTYTQTHPGEAVRFYWDLQAALGLQRFVGCGCAHVILCTNGLLYWSWESSRRTGLPDWIETVDGRTVLSATPPPEFVAFVKKHIELMYTPGEQKKRALKESP